MNKIWIVQIIFENWVREKNKWMDDFSVHEIAIILAKIA